jgi:nicotinate phosphoribosyltransferase
MKNACYFIPTYYFDWLKSFRFNPKQLNITYNEETKELGIEATGLLYEVTLWEVPILAIISEVQTLEQGPIDTLYIIRKTVEKATIAERNNLKFSEFGTRRRASFSVQDLVVET